MSTTPRLDALVAQDPDFVDRIFEYLLAEFPEIAGPRLAEIKSDVRDEFSGQQVYIAHQPPTDRQARVHAVLALFDGRNATEVARRLQISRATVYRILKQEGGKKSPSQVSWK
jgi:Mor family transcriptional regulator